MNTQGPRHSCLLVLALIAALAVPPATEAQPKDFTSAKLEELGVELAAPKKDGKSGFIVAGKNATALIKDLKEIQGIAIADLEKVMRPGAMSMQGFLGEKESLLEILAADNKYVVDELALTHQELAKHMLILGAIGKLQPDKEFLYHGTKFKVGIITNINFMPSPFKDGTKSNAVASVHNLSTGKKLTYSLLVPLMVERYGFYEGKGTVYRVDPAQIVTVLSFLKPKVPPK